MEIERFKTKLTKGQLQAMAIDTVKTWMDSVSPLDALTFAKRLKIFSDELIKESETEAKMVWDIEKSDHPEMSYSQGGDIKNYEEDPVYKDLKNMLQQRKELLDTAFKQDAEMYDVTGVEVPKVSIKNYRKDSINVKI